MALQIKRKTRMYEPYGYCDQNFYESESNGSNADLSKFFAKTEYVKDDNKIYFYNEHGTTKGVLDVNEFMKDDKIIEKAYYDHDSQSIIIKFTNGDTITVPVEDIIDTNEFKDGLTVDSGTTPSGKEISVVKVLKDPTSERWLTISTDGVKVSGIQAEIDRLDGRIDTEIEDRIADVDEEEARAISAETALNAKINAEITRSTNKDEEHDDQLNVLDQRLGLVERQLPDEISQRKERAFADASYDENTKEIVFKNALGNKIDSIDATPFLNDGMVERVYIDQETKELVIVWNAQSGQQETRIPLSEIFNPDSYYTKDEADAKFLTEHQDISNLATKDELNEGLSGKADSNAVYTQEEVDALILAKENEIYNLTKIVGDIGGAVTYEYPNEVGKSLTTLLGNNGTVKLTEDATISRFGPGITAKNNVKLNLNNHNLTSTSAGSYGAIMSRGTQEITIYGKGTIDSGDGICIEANGKDSIINLTGSTTVYQTNRPDAELIYCYDGTINIVNGTFKNNGSPYLLNCYDANYQNGTAKIIVSGGKFYDFNPGDNNAEGEHTSFLAEGYHVETSTVIEDGVEHTVYTVKKD